jgi:peptidoglycan/LPS O-acetylase OafA/YrhL
MKKNIPNLDLIRASAITMVLIYHCIQWLPDKNETVWLFAQTGKYGVDLFFALSGFLIGSLYFQEHKDYLEVNKLKFVARRASRTIPPYLIVLVPSFLGSYIFEGNSFDFKYLVFLQNYNAEIPFFKISWSLCVEEHFYTLLPFVVGFFFIVNRLNQRLSYILIAIIYFIPFIFRIVEFRNSVAFGYFETATHLRYDSLLAGLLLSFVFINHKQTMYGLLKYRNILIFLTCSLLLLSSVVSHKLFFTVGLLLLGIVFSLLVGSLSIGKQYVLGGNKVVQLIAKSSYAIYLTHALTINVIMLVNNNIMLDSAVLGGVLFCSSIAVGILFYNIIERPLMKIRDKIFPKRSINTTTSSIHLYKTKVFS